MEKRMSEKRRLLRQAGALETCHSPLCNEKVLIGDKFCNECRSKGYGVEKSVRHRRYDKYKRDSVSRKFYNSARWKKARQTVISRDEGKCQRCKRMGKIPPLGDVVHHIIPISETGVKSDLATAPHNLEVLCHDCHNKVHGNGRYN